MVAKFQLTSRPVLLREQIVPLYHFQHYWLILKANTANIKQLSGPERLPGLSRNGPQCKSTRTWHRPLFSAFKYPSYSTPLLKTNLITDQKRIALGNSVSAYADSSPNASRSSDVSQVKGSKRGDGKEERWKTTGRSCLQDGGQINADGGEILNLEHRPFYRAYSTGKVPCPHVQCLSHTFSSFSSPLALQSRFSRSVLQLRS